uniref:Nestin n=1 Tax=Ficedula albicollis TaxID=59894 RepID=A0A803VQ16_FICAL
MSQGVSRGVGDAPRGTAQPLGALPAPRLQYPAQLVSEVLHDALKAVEDDAQPKEEPAWAPGDACVPSPIFPAEAVPGEEQEGSEGGDSPEAEERAGEGVLQALGAESSAPQDRAVSPPGTAASLGASGSQEDLGAWEEEEGVPAVLSPRDPEIEAQEGDRDLPGQTVSRWEKPEQGEDRAQTPSTEPSHPSEEEEEEERGPHSPCRENGDFQEEGTDVQEEECPHREVEAARAVLAESHLLLLTKGRLGENFVDAEQERSEQQQMPACETDLAAEEERGQELCPQQSAHEATPAEEAWSGAGGDAVGGEDTGRVEGGEGEKGEASREVLGGEDQGVGQSPEGGEDSGAGEGSEAAEDPGAGEDSPEWESRAPEGPEDTQESSSVEEEGEQKPGEEPWGQGDDGHGQEPCPEDWEVTAQDTDGVWGPREPDGTSSSSGQLKSEERDGTLPAELEEAQEDDEEDARSQEMRQQQPVPEAEPAAELAGQEQQGSVARPEPAPPAAPEQGHGQELSEAPEEPWEGQEDDDGDDGHTQDPAQAPEEPWEGQEDDDDDDDDDGLSSELGKPESSQLVALKQVPGDSVESSGWALQEVPRDPEAAVGTGRRVELEDTLPDSTPLHLRGGAAASPEPPETEESTETAPLSDTAQGGEGWLEERDKPPTPTMPESPEEEAGVAAVAEEEEEEGYFMVSAPSQEVSSLEEAEISEDFEEIKVEATEGSQDDLGAPGEASPVPEGKAHPGVADENTEVPTEEAEVPKDEDDTAELEEGPAVPEADPSCAGATGPAAGGAGEPAQGATGTAACEGPEHPEGLAAGSDEELHSTAEPQRDGTGATTLPGCSLGLAGQQEEEEDEPSVALQDTAVATPPAGLQAEQPLQEKPSTEEETLDSDSREQLPGASPPQLGSALEQGGFPESIPDIPDAAALSAELPLETMKDSDILEIVEQALEFHQELMGVAEGGQQGPGGTELPQGAGEDSSPASSSEEEPTVQEAELEGAVRAENGLHREASLEELAEFPEEMLNGISSTAPAQEPPTDTGVMPPTPGDGTAAKLGGAPLRGKLGAEPSPVPPALGEDVLCLAPEQPAVCHLRAEQEPCPSGDE